MAFKGKPSINKRNRELAQRERQKEKAARRDSRSATKGVQGDATASDPSLSAEEASYEEFQRALRERAEQDTADAERDALRRRGPT